MSTTTENKVENKIADTASTKPVTASTVKQTATTRQAAITPPASTDQSAELLVKRPASELTRLVFMALLGCAACIALVGVVGQANEPGTSPDDPAPAVIVELAD